MGGGLEISKCWMELLEALEVLEVLELVLVLLLCFGEIEVWKLCVCVGV